MIHFPLKNIRKTIDGRWEQTYRTEVVVIPDISENYTISLLEVPDDGKVNSPVSIPGYTETINYPPSASKQYYVNYNTGYIEFNSNDAGETVDISYYNKGSLIEAQDINHLNDKIDNFNSFYTVSDVAPSGNVGDQWFNTTNNIVYAYDNLRSKWLSIDRISFTYGKDGLTNKQYLFYFSGSMPSIKSGLRIVRDACIVSLSAQFSNLGTGTFYIRKNNSQTTVTSLDIVNDYGNGDININIDVNEGDILHCYFESPFSTIYDPMITMELAWR